MKVKDMIDYTKVDRQLIYKDRSRLSEFKVDDLRENIEHQFYRRLSNERFMLLSVDAAKYALDIFNDAYYICTLFYMVEHPKLYHAWFRQKIAGRHKNKFLTTATMTLVYLLLGEERQPLFSEKKEFVKLVSHFILEDGDNVEVFNRLTNCVGNMGTLGFIKNPYTAERFERRDIFEILHADGYETLCAKNIDYVIEEVNIRMPTEEASKELLALRNKLEDYFEEYDILEYSDEEFNAWMTARDKIDTAIGYGEEDAEDDAEEDAEDDAEDDVEYEEEIDDDENNEDCEVDDNENDFKVVSNSTHNIFDNRINVDRVIGKVRGLYSDKVVGKRRWYVIFRVLYFLQWIGRSQKNFIDWVDANFQWEGKKEFRGVQSAFIHSNPCDWKNVIIEADDFEKSNENIGPDYYDFAVLTRDAFVDVDDDGTLHDKEFFLISPNQGAINHKNKWI
ncbi:MAG: hypothetical protein IJK46_08195 [Prevotella sp.]|nr:hypothetical protein [Prevotella sp.]